MANKIVEGLWDCPSCGTTGIGGRTKRCPGCGSPQGEHTHFYLAGEKKYLDEETAKDYGKGADWVCSYCGSDNRYNAEYCASCGSPREEKKGDLGSIKEPELPEAFREPAPPPKRRKLLPFLAAVLAVIIFFSWFTGRPRDLGSTVLDLTWTRNIAVEQSGIYDESDWTIPDEAIVYDSRREISGYNKVVDHYEDVQVRKSRQVISGYNTSTSYINNNDGTFTEVSTETPVYSTEYYYVTESRPVYRDEPVYATKYYYTIERWTPSNEFRTEGSGKSEPYWGEVTLGENERESYREEYYTVTVAVGDNKVYSNDVSRELWDSLNPGDSVSATIQRGMLTAINGISVN